MSRLKSGGKLTETVKIHSPLSIFGSFIVEGVPSGPVTVSTGTCARSPDVGFSIYNESIRILTHHQGYLILVLIVQLYAYGDGIA